MTDEITPSVTEQLFDLKTTVTGGARTAASAITEAIEDGKKPGRVLDTLGRMTREAPLSMLLAAFLLGRALARRRG